MAQIPFEFVLEALFTVNPRVKRMFGVQAVYVGEKIVLALKLSEQRAEDNGVWVSTTIEHHESLKQEVPALEAMRAHGIKSWLLLSHEADDFEESANQICEMIRSGDPRVGTIPKPKKKKSA